MDANLTQSNDQLLAELREKALQNPSAFLDNDNYLKSLACCMMSQWINEQNDCDY